MTAVSPVTNSHGLHTATASYNQKRAVLVTVGLRSLKKMSALFSAGVACGNANNMPYMTLDAGLSWILEA